MDDVFKALADSSRRLLLDSLNRRNGQTLRELCAELDMARQSVSKHLAVLEAANLVTTVWRGREKLHYLNAAPINEMADRWINRYDQRRVEVLSDLKRALEDTSMTTNTRVRPEFVYTTYISSTPERVWQALTDPAFTERYWQTSFETDWKTGSPMVWVQNGRKVEHPEQVVLESDPYRRLSYAWHTFSQEWAAAYEVDEELRTKLAAEPRSRVTFEIEPDGEQIRLTVIHEGFEPGSTILEMISGGWPKLIAGLKTLLETGSAPGED